MHPHTGGSHAVPGLLSTSRMKSLKRFAAVPLLRDQPYRERLSGTGSGASLSSHPGEAKTDAGLQQAIFFSFFFGKQWRMKETVFPERKKRCLFTGGITRCLAGFDLKKLHKFPESTAEPRVRQSVGIFHCCLLRAHKKWLLTGSWKRGGVLLQDLKLAVLGMEKKADELFY